MAKRAKRRRRKPADDRIFTLEVFLIEGMTTKKFTKRNSAIGRTILIRGDQTLEELHQAIYHAFDREEEHLYEFQFGGGRINDPNAIKYITPELDDGPLFQEEYAHEGLVDTTIGEIGLEPGDIFGYRFDFGDEWLHQVNVKAVDERGDGGFYPRLIDKKGESPQQYDYDNEEVDAEYDEDKQTLNELRAEVPEACEERFLQIATLTDAISEDILNVEYKRLARELVLVICQDEQMILKGRPKSWATGVLYALGRVNFLDDPEYDPYLKMSRLAEYFGVSVATMRAKGKAVADKLGLAPFHPDWTLPSLLDINPMVWMLKLDGVIMDARKAPRTIQELAFEEGLIPYIPADRDGSQPDE